MKIAIKIIPMISVFVYLCVGMISGYWHPGWIIVVAGGLISGILKIIDESMEEKKKQNEETPEE